MSRTARPGPADADYEALFRSTYPRLVTALTVAAGRAAAEDAVQDAYLQALRHWEKVRHYDDPAGWVRRAALHRLANQRRGIGRRDRAVERLGSTTVGAVPGPEPTRTDELRAALADLPERERTVVVLHHVVGVPVAELATDLDLPEGTVKSILSRSRARLRSSLTEVVEPDLAAADVVDNEGGA